MDYASVVAMRDTSIGSLWEFGSKVEKHSRHGSDVGLLRFPSVFEPYFVVSLRRTEVTIVVLTPRVTAVPHRAPRVVAT